MRRKSRLSSTRAGRHILRGRHPIIRRAAELLAAVGLAAASLAPAVVTAQVAPPTFTFQVAGLADARLASSLWMLETRTDKGWVPVTNGVLAPDLGLSIKLPLDTVLSSIDKGFMLLVTQPLDSTHMLMAIATEGHTPDHVRELGNTLTFHPVVLVAAARQFSLGTPPPVDAPTAMNDAPSVPPLAAPPPLSAASSAVPQAPSQSPSGSLLGPNTNATYLWINGGGCLGRALHNLPPDCTPGGGDLRSYSGPGQNLTEAVPVIPTTPDTPNVSIPSNGACAVTGCNPTTASDAPSPQSDGSCSSHFDWWSGNSSKDCTTSSLQQNVETFRGWSSKVPGDSVQPLEDYNYTQSLDWGVRAQAGPFSVSGGKDSTYTAGGTVSFKHRGDCWSPPTPGDDCGPSGDMSKFGGYGWWEHAGQDLWRWEHHHVYRCDTQTCFTSDFETVFDVSNNGGNDTFQLDNRTGQGAKPGDARDGIEGAAAHWNPDTGTQTKYLGGAETTQVAADFEAQWTNAFGGSISFKAAATDTSYQKFYNQHTLRGPNTGLPFMGGWYDYDGNHSPTWSWDYWTCYYKPGWGPGATVQSEALTQQYGCWDYTAAGSPPV
jgi:hypothetical protein